MMIGVLLPFSLPRFAHGWKIEYSQVMRLDDNDVCKTKETVAAWLEAEVVIYQSKPSFDTPVIGAGRLIKCECIGPYYGCKHW